MNYRDIVQIANAVQAGCVDFRGEHMLHSTRQPGLPHELRSRPQAANLEVKSMDPAANPYLALGAIVAAGIDGLERELSLPEPVLDDPASIPAPRRRKLGIRQLPSSLGAAITELERSSLIRGAMGNVLFDSFLATRRGEQAAFEGKDPDTVVRAHRWRY